MELKFWGSQYNFSNCCTYNKLNQNKFQIKIGEGCFLSICTQLKGTPTLCFVVMMPHFQLVELANSLLYTIGETEN